MIKKIAKISVLAFSAVLLLTTCVDRSEVSSPFPITNHVEDWRDEIIYQIIIDRFADGDISNNYNVDKTDLTAWQGGDYQGVIDKIPYLKKLGITAVWISPVVKNVEEDAGIGGYHGYWTQDFMSVNPHFGDLAKLREMIKALHDNNIKVILDIVANHIGPLFYYDINRNNQPDEMVMGSNMDCGDYCSRIMMLEDEEAGQQICDEEYGGADFKEGECYHYDGCTNKECYDRCTDRCINENYPHKMGIKRYSEWDPDFDPRGIMAFSEAGESGPAPIRWIYMPEVNRVPPYPKEFQNKSWYNSKGRIVTWESDYQVVKGDFPGGLKDLDTTNPDVIEALIRVYKYWIGAINIDGFRVDTIKHVEHEFWREFTPAMRNHAENLGKKNFFIFGEAFDGRDELLGSFTKNMEMDSVFYFSQKFQVFDSIFKNNGPTSNFEKLYNLRMNRKEDGSPLDEDHPNRYGTKSGVKDSEGNILSPQQLLVNFIDNHDLPRFLYDKADENALRNALTLLLTMDGIPCIYYGTEQNFNGGNDPANRENLAESKYDTENETFRHISRLTALRTEHAPLRRGDMTIRWATDHTGEEQDAGILAFERSYRGETALVIINTNSSRSSETAYDGNAMATSFESKTVLKDIIHGEYTAEVGKEGTLIAKLEPLTAFILMKK